MIDLQDENEADTDGVVTSKDQASINKPRNWVDVVSKSVKKANVPSQKMHAQQIEVVNSVLYEERERDKRKNNLLIFGLGDQNEDSNVSEVQRKVVDILKLIGVDVKNMIKARRFRSKAEGSPNPNPAPVFVQMNNEGSRNRVLKEARKLRGVQGMKTVYIKPDQTEAERVLEKQLRQRRDELNRNENEQNSLFRWSILKGDIRKFRTDIPKVKATKQQLVQGNTPNEGANNINNGKPTEGANFKLT